MAFSRTTLVYRIRRLLDDNPFVDICTEAMDTTEVGLDVALLEKYDLGAIVEFQDDGEQCLVTAMSATSGAGTLTVIRGYNSTTQGVTGTSHSASAAIARDPVFQYIQIQEAIESVLRSFWPYVYQEINFDLTPNTDGNKWYDLTGATLMELSSVAQIVGTGAASRVMRYGERGGAYPVQLFNNIPVAKVASGQGLYIPYLASTTNHIFVNGIGKIDATYAAPNYSSITDGVQVDCVTYYAVARLVAGSDIRRTTQEDIAMGDQTVVPGRRTEVASYWEAKGLERRHQWEQELRVTLPRMQSYYRGGRAQGAKH